MTNKVFVRPTYVSLLTLFPHLTWPLSSQLKPRRAQLVSLTCLRGDVDTATFEAEYSCWEILFKHRWWMRTPFNHGTSGYLQ
jgi:hypothetical protein